MGASLLLLLVLVVATATGQRIKDSIYTEIEQIRPCFRRLNGSGEIGCTSALGGNVGVVQYLEEAAGVEELLQQEFGPYIVLLDPRILSGELLRRLRASGQVVGVVLPAVEEGRWAGHYPPKGYSSDSPCPNSPSLANQTSSCSPEDRPWNPRGSSSMWEDWGFPIFLVQDSNSTEALHKCWLEHNQAPLSWPLCSAELKGNMYAAKDSETCIRRSNLFNITPLTVCDALSDSNTVYMAKARNATLRRERGKEEEAEGSVIVVAARMDALAMFDQVEVGFDSPSTGLVTLLAAARQVAEALRDHQLGEGVENILFLLLHGESFDYMGSSRLVYDMARDAFPYNISQAEEENRFLANGTQPRLTLAKVRFWLELGQLAPTGGSEVFLHSSGDTGGVTRALLAHRGGLKVSTSTSPHLPPSSATSLQGATPAVVVTNFDRQYSEGMFHSIYDSAAYHGYNFSLGEGQAVVAHLTQVAAMVAAAVLEVAGVEVEAAAPQAKLVNELLHCYTLTANCTMFHEASEPGNFPWTGRPATAPFPQYVGVRGSAHTSMTKMLLQYLTGETVEPQDPLGIEEVRETRPDLGKAREACLARNQRQTVYSYVYLVGKDCYNKTTEVVECGRCYRSTVFLTPASSPAFLPGVMETYDWSSGLYPTWTESIWKVISARVFLRGDPRFDHGVFSLGVLLLLTSLTLVWWVERRAALIFGEASCAAPAPVHM